MISFIRSFFGSKLGLAVTLGFLGLIGFAFAASDVANTGSLGGISAGDNVAVVGDRKIGNGDFFRTVNSSVEQLRRDNPTITMPAFVAQGGIDSVMQQMIDRYAVGAYAEEHGLRAGENLINSEILQISAFRGPDGNFSKDAFQAALRQQGVTEALLRQDIADSLLARQLIVPALSGAHMPQKLAARYASLLRERRVGAVGFLPAAAFAPTGEPSAAQLDAFYKANREDYVRPERRVLRYAVFGLDNLDRDVTPTTAEIAARYQRDRAKYAAREDRALTQLIVPTQDAANSLRQRVAGGASLEAVAREAGFSTTKLGPLDQAAYSATAGADVAKAVFAAARGSIAQPARSALGWHVVRIDAVNRIAERSLASVTPEITTALLAEKRAAALADLSARVEEQVAEGVSFSQVAQQLGVTADSTPPLTADGRVFGNSTQSIAPQLRGAVATAFQMEEGEPQIAEIERGATYLVFEVAEVTPSAAPPLAEIRPQVVQGWRLGEGAKRAQAAADRVIKRMNGGSSFAEALAAEKVALPAVDTVNLDRQQLLEQGQQIPPPLALLFSMAEGTTKRLEAPNRLGWFVVDLDDIQTPQVAANDPLIAAARQQLRGAIGDELAAQL
ncbi:MAG: peptidyl-prolyl cis-trans isomerase, partial [Erythrobacter sp.]